MLKWVLGILGALVVLGGVGVGAYMLGKTAASDPWGRHPRKRRQRGWGCSGQWC